VSIFPTKILLATDRSEDAELAATTVAGLAKITGSEVHLVNVGVVAPALLAPLDVEPARVEREVRDILDEQVRKVENTGGTVAQSHVRVGEAAREVVKRTARRMPTSRQRPRRTWHRELDPSCTWSTSGT
jgi:nucleotide-binding universal stress UspA family protein